VSNIIWHVLCVWTMVTYITLKLTAADAKERKRERDRARWLQQKDAINKRRREKYHQRKNQHVLVTTNCNAWILTYCHGVMNWHLFFLTDICNVYNFVDDEAASNKENVDQQMIGSIGMIPIIPTILLMRTCPLNYHVIKYAKIF